MSTIKFKPLFDRILIKQKEVETKLPSGIIVPESSKEKPLEGLVVAVGAGRPDEEMVIKVGDSILFGAYSGTVIKIEGIEYLIMRQSDAYGIS